MGDLHFLFADPFIEAYYDQLDTDREQRVQAIQRNLTPATVLNTAAIGEAYPNLPRSVVAAAGLVGAVPGDALTDLAKRQTRQDTNWWDDLYVGTKATARGAFTTFDALWEEILARPFRTLVGYGSQGPTGTELRQVEQLQGLEPGSLGDHVDLERLQDPAFRAAIQGAVEKGMTFRQMGMSLSETYQRAGQSIGLRAWGELTNGRPVNLGSGWLPSSTEPEQQPEWSQLASQVGEEEARRQLNLRYGEPISRLAREEHEQLLYHNMPISFGRVTAAHLPVEPGSDAYNVLSGLVDAGAQIALDPFSRLYGGVKWAGVPGIRNLRQGSRAVLTAGVEDLGRSGALSAARRSVYRPSAEEWLSSARGRWITAAYDAATPDDMADIVAALRNMGGRSVRGMRHRARALAESTDTRAVFSEMLGTEIREIPATGGLGAAMLERAGVAQPTVSGALGGGLARLAGGTPTQVALARAGGFRVGMSIVNDRRGWSRLFGTMGSRELSIANPDQGLFDLDDLLTSWGLTRAQRSPYLYRWSQLADDASADEAWGIFSDAARTQKSRLAARFEGWGLKRQTAQLMAEHATRSFVRLEELRKFATEASGDVLMGPHTPIWMDTTARFGVAQPSASMVAEFLQRSIPLPDARAMRKALGRLRRFTLMTDSRGRRLVDLVGTEREFGENILNRIADPFMQEFWKPFTLLRIAWPMRVLLDDQLRHAAAGLDSFLAHPIRAIGWAMFDPDASKAKRVLMRLGVEPKGQTSVLTALAAGWDYDSVLAARRSLTKAADRALAQARRLDSAAFTKPLPKRSSAMTNAQWAELGRAAKAADADPKVVEAWQGVVAARKQVDDYGRILHDAGLTDRDVMLAMTDERNAVMSLRGDFYRGQSGNPVFRNAWRNYPRTSPQYPQMWAGELRQLWSDAFAPRVAADPAAAKAWFLSDDVGAVALRAELRSSGTGFRKVVGRTEAEFVASAELRQAAAFYVDFLNARITVKTGGNVALHWVDDAGVTQTITNTGRVPIEYVRLTEAGQWDRISYEIVAEGDRELRQLITDGYFRGNSMTGTAGGEAYDELIGRLHDEFRPRGPETVKGPIEPEGVQGAKSMYHQGVDALFDVLGGRLYNVLSRHPAFAQYYWQRVEELLPFLDDAGQDGLVLAARKANLPPSTLRRMERAAGRARGGRDKATGLTPDQVKAQRFAGFASETSEQLIERVRRSGIVSTFRRLSREGVEPDTARLLDELRLTPDGEEGVWALRELWHRQKPGDDLADRMVLHALDPAEKPSEALGQIVGRLDELNFTEEFSGVNVLKHYVDRINDDLRRVSQGGKVHFRPETPEEEFLIASAPTAAHAVVKMNLRDAFRWAADDAIERGADPEMWAEITDASIALLDEMVDIMGPEEAWRAMRSLLDPDMSADEAATVLTQLDDIFVGNGALEARLEKAQAAFTKALAGRLAPRPRHAGITMGDLSEMGFVPLPGPGGTQITAITDLDPTVQDVFMARGFTDAADVVEFANRRGMNREELYAYLLGPRESAYEEARLMALRRAEAEAKIRPSSGYRRRLWAAEDVTGPEEAGLLRSAGPGGAGRPRGGRRPARTTPTSKPTERWVPASEAPDAGRAGLLRVELSTEQRRIAEGTLDRIMRHPAMSDALDDVEAVEGTLGRAGGRAGNIGIHDVHRLAAGWAGDKVKGLLYDVHRKHQFFDAFRNVFPFGEAWLEIMSTWARLMWENPVIFRRAQQVFEGGRESGFLHRDPETGEEMFSYPAGGVLAGLASRLADLPGVGAVLPGTGAADLFAGMGTSEVRLEGRLAGLNLFTGQWLPGFGPLVQIPASHVLEMSRLDPIIEALSPWEGQTVRDWLSERAMPFGEQKLDSQIFFKLLPVWMRRVLAAYNIADGNMMRLKDNTTIDIVRALLLAGHPASTAEDLAALQAKAESMSSSLALVRGLAQMISPTGPEVKFYSHVTLPPDEFAILCRPAMYGLSPEERDQLVARIAAAPDIATAEQIAAAAGVDVDRLHRSSGTMWLYQSLASEYRERLFGEFQGDDQAAFEWFTKTFGLEPTIFSTPKTMQIARRHTTYEGDYWAREHPDLFAVAPLTAYYAHPDDELDPFDYDAYTRQLEEEARATINPDQWLWRRNDTLGRILYERARQTADERFGTGDSDVKTQALTMARQWIADNYPGFLQPIPGAPQSPSLASKIEELTDVWPLHPDLAESDAGQAVKLYLEARARAMEVAASRGVQPESFATAKRCRDLRDALRAYAVMLGREHRDFVYLWTLVLQHELTEDLAEATVPTDNISTVSAP